MEKVILIAGLGTMGTNYARNLSELAKEFELDDIVAADIDFEACRRIHEEFPELLVYHINPNANSVKMAVDGKIGVSPDLKSLIEYEKPTGFIGATQTDSHVDVLEDTLAAKREESEAPYIHAILQEKPFGLFDEDSERRAAIQEEIEKHEIIFNLDSILMFSEIWDIFERKLGKLHLQGYKHHSSFCTYGKNRLNDTRPAHEGIWGTEGTHAIDIARRQGHLLNGLETVDMAVVKQGFVNEASPDIPYYCMADLTNEFGVAVGIEMALNFDRPVRRVIHHYQNAEDIRDMLSIELNFDFQNEAGEKVDRLVLKGANGAVLETHEIPANLKLANALRASFGVNASSLYGIDSTNALRDTIADIRSQANTTQLDVEVLTL